MIYNESRVQTGLSNVFTLFKHLTVNIFVVQTMNILIVNQSVIDMCASFFTLLTAVVKVDDTRMSRDSIYDQFTSG